MAGKAKIIISDLHLGAGFAPDNPLEDFVTDDEFAQFMGDIVAESDQAAMDVELIINGDMVEFLQVPAVDVFDPRAVYPPEVYRPSSEEASVRKMSLVIAGHPTLFAAMRGFINPAHPRRNITIIKGNHDVNLHWTAVQSRIREAVGATGDRQGLLTFEERRVTREGIYVEHGNQYTEKVSRFDDFEEPHDHERIGELAIPPGSNFVIDFFNDVEREKWWVDAVKPITALIWYGFALDFAFAARVLVNFLRAAPGLVVGSFAVEGEPDLGVQIDELRQRLEDENEVAALSERYAADESFRSEFNAHLARMLQASDTPPEFASLAPAEVAAEEADALERARDIAEITDAALRRVAQAKIVQERAQVIVFGHTHRALCEQLDGGMHLNSGTWVWWRDFAGTDPETWKRFYSHPEEFTQPHFLTYVRVDYDQANQPHARVLDYTGQYIVECLPPDEGGGRASWWTRLMRP